MTLISVIIPVYNVEDYIHQCVESVLNQTYKNFEIILVNDGSPDNCPIICDEYASKDNRITVIHKKNGGLSDARNFGIKEAKGDYLLFLDSDDYWNNSNFLLKICETISNDSDVQVINFGVVKYFPISEQYIAEKRNFSLSKKSSETDREYIKNLLINDLFIASACNKCLKKDFILENQLFFQKGLLSEDMEWCGNILFLMPHMTSIDLAPYVYRQDREGSITGSVNINHIYDMIGMIKNALNNSKKLNSEDRYLYLSFYAVQYLTLLYNINVSKVNLPPELLRDVYELRKIVDNNLNYKVKKVGKIMKIFGYRLMSWLLCLYVLNTRK